MDKYIVYQTTNLINNHIYIGVHKTKNPEIFDGYLGNGIYINQDYTYKYAKTKLQQAVCEYGPKNFKRTTIQIFDNENDAYTLESQLVDLSFLQRNDVYNMVVGGLMQDYRNIPTYQYDINTGNYLTSFESIKEAANFVGVNPGSLREGIVCKRKIKGFFWTTYKVDKIDLSQFNTNFKNIRPVSLYSKEGEFIKTYDNCSQLGNAISIHSGEVLRAAKLGYLIGKSYYVSFLQEKSFDIAKTKYLKIRKVYKYDSAGNFIKEYNTQEEAEQENFGSNITKSVKHKTLDKNGYIWSLEKVECLQKPSKNYKKRIGRFDDQLNLLEEFDSGTACAKIWGKGVWHCLKGEYPKHKGYIFKQID